MLKIMKTQSIRMLLFSLLLGIASVVYAQVQVTGRVVDITGGAYYWRECCIKRYWSRDYN